jgi:3-demethoxyubiquinol 3-hydroxylase
MPTRRPTNPSKRNLATSGRPPESPSSPRFGLPKPPSLDALICAAESTLRTLSGGATASRPMPSRTRPSQSGPSSTELTTTLDESARQQSGALMRVNHVGEVCAQALYQAQALTARSPQVREQMLAAAREELDHLAWTQQRLDELGARPSLLNPLWYAGSFAMGLAAGLAGDRMSLAFLNETERQVEQHLQGHLEKLPADDHASRAVVEQMRQDEGHHAEEALASGGATVPKPVSGLMRAVAKVMTTTAHRV